MATPKIAPYGTWTSTLSAADVAAETLHLSCVAVDGDDIYWLEGRPQEGGRNVVVRCTADGNINDITPKGIDIRTRVHEYGGGAFTVIQGNIFYINSADQRLYQMLVVSDLSDAPLPQPLTQPGHWFYADFTIDLVRQRLICIREDHTVAGQEAVTTLVLVSLEGMSEVKVIASGYNFYSTPRFSADGCRLAWLSWNHPLMPWDGTELWVADVNNDGLLENCERIAGGTSESIYQPEWSVSGELYFISDRTGWWQLYRYSGECVQSVLQEQPPLAEFGRPQWILGTSSFAMTGPSSLLASYVREGHWRLATINTETEQLADISTKLQPLEWVTATKTHAIWIGASSLQAPAVVKTDLQSGITTTLRTSNITSIDAESISKPVEIVFPTDGDQAHGFFYPPCNSNWRSNTDEHPPLIVLSHGGPTAAASSTLNLKIQFWTSRGFGVVDVNYRGSSGYGREYRQKLHGQWGIVDVVDVVNAARYLVDQGQADAQRLIIRGASAGGYTTLAALVRYPEVFSAGASYYGVVDIEALARDTHKFESRYLETLVGSYTESRDLYLERSPIHAMDQLACPLILFQGLEDRVVPPNQSQMVAEAARAKGLPVKLLTFDGEQHGFKKAETIVRCFEAELSFYKNIFGLVSDSYDDTGR